MKILATEDKTVSMPSNKNEPIDWLKQWTFAFKMRRRERRVLGKVVALEMGRLIFS